MINVNIKMKFWLGFTLICLFCVIPCGPVYSAGVTVKASVDRTQTAPDTPIRLNVTIQGGEGRVDTSNIKDFKVISKGSSTSIKMFNQNVTRELIYSYTLIPLKKGRLVIPQLSVFLGKEIYKTAQIEIMVSDTVAKEKGAVKYFATAEISEKTPFQGQQIIYTFKLFHAVSIKNTRFQEPHFKNFTSKRLEGQKNYQKTLKQATYQVVELSWVLVPLKTGKQTIGPSILQCSVEKPGGRSRRFGFDSFFDDSFFNRRRLETKILKTDQVSVEVKPLPEYNGEDEFSGLVGNFNIQSELKEKVVKVGDSATLSIIVSGNGNIMDTQEIKFKAPKAFKVYKDNPDEDVKLGPDGFYGRKTYRFALVPIKAGTFHLPEVELNYFDVSSGTYKIKTATSLLLKVDPSEEDQTESIGADSGSKGESIPDKIQKKKVEFTGRDILPLKDDLAALENKAPLTAMGFTIYMIFPLLLFLSIKYFIVLTRKKDDPSSMMAQRADALMKNASKKGHSNEEFLLSLYRGLISAILSKADVIGESLTCREAKNILLERGCSMDLSDRTVKLLEKIESIKYGGEKIAPEIKKEMLTNARKIIRDILS